MKTSELGDWKKRQLGPASVAARNFFRTPAGKTVIDTLDRVFGQGLVEKDPAGRIDPSAVLIRVGEKNVIDYLRGLANNEEEP